MPIGCSPPHSARAPRPAPRPVRRPPPLAEHPVLEKHPVTGENLLFFSRRHAEALIGVSPEESEALMDEIATYFERSESILRHEWRVGDVVLWDNLAIQHARTDYNPE